jgi:outer membrane protein OmpA-like peptidoglycan-associated protein
MTRLRCTTTAALRSFCAVMLAGAAAVCFGPDIVLAQTQDAETIVKALLPKTRPAPPPQPLVRSFIQPSRGIAIDGPEARDDPAPSIDLTVNFEYDQSALTMSDAQIAVDTLGRALSDPRLATMRFMIIGHTDTKGGDAYNLALSQRRAEAVRSRLVQFHHVDASRLVAEGHGLRELKDPARPEDAVNRRVQIKTIGAEPRVAFDPRPPTFDLPQVEPEIVQLEPPASKFAPPPPRLSGRPLAAAIAEATNEIFPDFQKKCGAKPLPETIAFVGLPEHEPRISESLRRWLNSEILKSAGGSWARPTEVAALALLAPFLSLGKKGEDEMKTAEDRIAGSPMAILADLRRPSTDMLQLTLSFLDRRPGCSDSTARSFFITLPALEIADERLPPGGDDDIHELLGFYYAALAEAARPLTVASKLLTTVHFDLGGQCDLRRETKTIFEAAYQQLRQDVARLPDSPALPPMSDGDFAELRDAAIPEDAVLIRLRFTRSSISRRLLNASIEVIHKGAKQYTHHANVVVDERSLAGCGGSSAIATRSQQAGFPLPQLQQLFAPR